MGDEVGTVKDKNPDFYLWLPHALTTHLSFQDIRVFLGHVTSARLYTLSQTLVSISHHLRLLTNMAAQ